MGNKVDAMSTLDTVPERVRYLSEVAPHKELFVFYDGYQRSAYTASDVYQMAGRFATKLRQRGFQRHDIVANTLPNSPERVVTDLGIILAGCVAMNSQIILADGKDFVHAANKSECKGVIMSTAGNSPAWSLLKGDVTEEKPPFFARVANQQVPHLQTAVLVSRATNGHGLSFMEELKSSTDEPLAEDIQADDTVVIFSTSGTTGYSKLVPHSNHHILQMSSAMCEAARGRGRVAHPGLNTQPFYNDRLLGWSGGFPYTSLCNGDTRVLLDYFTGTKRTGELMHAAMVSEGCKICVTSMGEVEELCRVVQGQGDLRLDTLFCGGHPLTKVQVAKVLTLADHLVVSYGSTETGVITWGHLNEKNNTSYKVGKPVVDAVQIRIINDNGDPCLPGEVGTVQILSPLTFRGYLNRLESPDPQTMKVLRPDGWYSTEDNGYFGQDGDLYILGRKNDVIQYGVFLLYPGWLEEKIVGHPEIAEACVVPVSDPLLFHNICACVSLAEGSELTEEEIRTYCKNIFLKNVNQALTPVPAYFLILQEGIPRNSNGKPHVQKLKAIAEEKFGCTARHTM